MNSQPERRDRKSEEIAKHVMRQVQDGVLQVGERLPSERDLSQQLGVSRPLVREGYRILESLGVVEVRQGSGVYIADRQRYDAQNDPIWNNPVAMLDVLDVADVMSARTGELAARLITDDELTTLRALFDEQRIATEALDLEALPDIDDAFHMTIIHASHNPILESFEVLSRRLLNRDRILLLGSAAERSLAEHAQIVHALELRDPVMASLAMQHHAVRSHAVFRDLIARQPATLLNKP